MWSLLNYNDGDAVPPPLPHPQPPTTTHLPLIEYQYEPDLFVAEHYITTFCGTWSVL